MIVDRFTAAYEREIEGKPMNSVVFYGGFAVLTFLIVFVFGIRPTAVALAQNLRYKMELEDIRGQMQTKLAQIQTESAKLDSIPGGLVKLNRAIPDGVFFQEFLGELVIKSAGSGFVIQGVRQSDVQGKEIPMDVEAAGQTENVGEFLDAIEGMDRFVDIMDIRLATEGSAATLKMRVRMYTL